MIGEPRLHEASCASTQAILIDRAHDLPEGAVATADHQTAGRGRLDRSWQDAPGTSILCSILLRPPPGHPFPELSLVAAVATAEAVESHTGLEAQIKWPNDVLVQGRKVAGILAEARGEVVVLGIGVNVNQTAEQLPPVTRRPPGSLRLATGREHDRETVLATLFDRLSELYDAWREHGLEAIHDGLSARNMLFGRPLRVGEVAGTGGAIALDGRLEVMTPAGPTLVESGEVEVGP